jgi:hypothetical protein
LENGRPLVIEDFQRTILRDYFDDRAAKGLRAESAAG